MNAEANKPQWLIEQDLRLYFTRPIDKTEPEYMAFIKKRKFTIREFATLLAGLRPWVFDNSSLADEIYQRRIKPFVDLIVDRLEADVPDGMEIWDPEYIEPPYTILCGYPSDDHDKDESPENYKFHLVAYVAFCQKKQIPLPFEYNEDDYLPRPGNIWPEDRRNRIEIKSTTQVIHSEERETPTPTDIDITLLAKYLAPNSENYAPRLAILPEILRRIENQGITINDGKKFALGEGRNLLDGELKAQAEIVYKETFKTEIPKTLLKAYADILKK